MIGRTLHGFHIVEELGRGGMGVVYLAEDTTLPRRLALKFLAPEVAREPEARARFRREAESVARLGERQHICPVYQVLDSDAGPFLVMPLLEGGTLADRLARGPLPPEAAAEVAREIADGLAAAHEQGIVHRDVKPANVMFDGDGRVRLTDFGLATAADATRVTRTRTTLGTAHYMAPEQIGSRDVDARADLWALGVILYQMLTGRNPFARDTLPASLYAVVHDEPPDVAAAREGLQPGLVDLIRSLLAKDPAARPPDARTVSRNLRALHEGVDPGSATVRLAPHNRPRLTRRRIVLAIVPIALLVIVAALITHPPRWPRETDAPVLPARALLLPVRSSNPGDASLAVRATDTIEHALAPLVADGWLLVARGGPGDGESRFRITGRVEPDPAGMRLQARVEDLRRGELVHSLPAVVVDPSAPGTGLEEAASRVAGLLAVHLDPELREPLPEAPPRLDAWEVYVEGLRNLLPAQQALIHLQRAVALDSTFLRPKIVAAAILAEARRPEGTALLDELSAARERLVLYERHLLAAVRARSEPNFERALVEIREARLAAPDAFLARERHIEAAWAANYPREGIEVHETTTIPESFARTNMVEYMLRKVADLYHMAGDYAEELAFSRELIERYPATLRVRGLELRALAALGDTETLELRVEELLARPEHRGNYAYVVTPAITTLLYFGREQAAHAVARDLLRWYETVPEGRQATRQTAIDQYVLHSLAGEYGHARVALDSLLARTGGITQPWHHAALGVLAAHRGDREEALGHSRSIEEWPWPGGRPNAEVAAVGQAEIFAALGEKDRAVERLRHAFAQQGLHHAPRFRENFPSLRGYEPFERLMRPRG